MTWRLVIFFILFAAILFGTSAAAEGKAGVYLISGILWTLSGCIEIYVYHAFMQMGIIGALAVAGVIILQLSIMNLLNPNISLQNRIFALLTFLFCL